MSLTESFDVADISNPQPGQVYVERMAETVGPLPAGRLGGWRPPSCKPSSKVRPSPARPRTLTATAARSPYAGQGARISAP